MTTQAPVEPGRHSEPRPSLAVAIGRVLFNTRNALFPIALIVFALASRPLYPFGLASWDLAMDLFGFAVALAGQALRVAVIGLDYIQRGGKNRQIHADHLVTGGFFAHSRNPLYVGNWLVYLGLFIMLNSVVGWLVGVPFFLIAYLCITAAEEDFLSRQFGAAYAEYKARVPRYWPNWKGLGATMRGMEFDWKRVIRKEYGSTFSWITTALALVWWETYRNQSAFQAYCAMLIVLGLWAPVVLGYVIARVMKKSGALQST